MKSRFFFHPNGDSVVKPAQVVEKFVYPGGSFARYSREGKSEWVEAKADGSSEFRFVETAVTRIGFAFSIPAGTWCCVCPLVAACVSGPRTKARRGTHCTVWKGKPVDLLVHNGQRPSKSTKPFPSHDSCADSGFLRQSRTEFGLSA